MNLPELQARIDAITWYHEFDFGRGLKARSRIADAHGHRQVWSFIERNLDTIDFTNKSVLDIGCWDGYWSFYAERRGARSVFATDDKTQKWVEQSGLGLAKELLGSSVQVDEHVSVYDLASLNRTFDVIMFLGVYYHLLDPFFALAQIRHCCHDNTLVLIEGSHSTALSPATALFQFSNHMCEWMPTREALTQLLSAAYFRVVAVDELTEEPRHLPGRRWRLRLAKEIMNNSRDGVRRMVRELEPGGNRVFMKCVPFEGTSELHVYRPPFGLHRYDDRFRDG